MAPQNRPALPFRLARLAPDLVRLLLLSLVLALAPAPAGAARYLISPGEPNLVVFRSDAPMESFEGKTRAVEGALEADPESLADSIAVEVAVDLASLDTGIPLRNRHMRENHLETETYPKAIFRGGRLEGVAERSLPVGKAVSLVVAGEFEVHGVARPMRIPLEVSREANGDLRIRGKFVVSLQDHGIPRPQFLFLKLDDAQKITLDLRAFPEP